MIERKCAGSAGSEGRDDDEQAKIQKLSQNHILRYIAELTEEMSRLADDHECAELANDLSAVAKKARRELIGSG